MGSVLGSSLIGSCSCWCLFDSPAYLSEGNVIVHLYALYSGNITAVCIVLMCSEYYLQGILCVVPPSENQIALPSFQGNTVPCVVIVVYICM